MPLTEKSLLSTTNAILIQHLSQRYQADLQALQRVYGGMTEDLSTISS